MMKYSFMSKYANCTKEQMIGLIQSTDKPCRYTYGYTWKNPTTYKVPITKDEAIAKLNSNGYVDADEQADCIHINEFSANDMW